MPWCAVIQKKKKTINTPPTKIIASGRLVISTTAWAARPPCWCGTNPDVAEVQPVTMITFFALFFQAEDGIRDYKVTGVQTCALPICLSRRLDLRQPLASFLPESL